MWRTYQLDFPWVCEMITEVAIIFEGQTYSLPKPYRHHDVICMIYNANGYRSVHGEQGFLDDKGNFMNRRVALAHALECGQVLQENIRFPELYSEDLW